jgi:hypothetical protein
MQGFSFFLGQSNLVIFQIKARYYNYTSSPYTTVSVIRGPDTVIARGILFASFYELLYMVPGTAVWN